MITTILDVVWDFRVAKLDKDDLNDSLLVIASLLDQVFDRARRQRTNYRRPFLAVIVILDMPLLRRQTGVVTEKLLVVNLHLCRTCRVLLATHGS